MPDVGTLNIKIQSDADQAAQGLKELAGALSAVQKAAPNGLNLAGISGPLNKFAKAINENSGALKNIGTFLNAVSEYTKVFKDASSVKFNTEPIKALKDAIGDNGISIGQVGTQMNKLRESFTADWGDTEKVDAVIGTMKNVAGAATELSAANTASTIKNVAKAIDEYANSINSVSGGGAHDYLQQQIFASVEESRMTGANAGYGIQEGMLNTKESVANASAEIAQTIIDTIKAKLDIHSPSGVGEEIGENIGQGIVIGLENVKGKIQTAASDAVNLDKETGAAESVVSLFRMFDSATGSYRNFNMQTNQFVDSIESAKMATHGASESVTDLIERLNHPIDYSGIQKYIDETVVLKDSFKDLSALQAFNIPAMDQDGLFKYASEEVGFYGQRLREAQADIEFFGQKYDEVQKRIKYNGRTTERENEAAQYEKSFYLAIAKAEEYENHLKQINDYITQYNTNMQGTTSIKDYFDIPEIKTLLTGLEGVVAQMAAIQAISSGTGIGIDEIKRQITELTDGAVQFGAAADTIEQSAEVAESGITEFGNATNDMNSSVVPTISVIQRMSDKFRDLKFNIEYALRSMELIGESGQTLTSGLKAMFPTITGLVKRFQSMAKMRAIRYIIRQVSAGVSEGLKNVYQYSKAVGTGLAPAMDSASTALLQMKNSIGAAIAPLIQMLVPALKTVISWVIQAVNALNQFFALLNGQSTWTEAVEYQTEAYEDNKDAAKSAAKAAKDLLADWDELNIIQSENGGGGSTGATGNELEYEKMFREVGEYAEWIRNLVDGIKERFGDIWGFVKRIGAVILGWKLANTFTNWLGVIGGLVGAALTLDITFNLVNMFADNFLKTGEPGYLVGDLLTTLIGGYFTKKILSKVLAGRFAALAIPLTLLVSAVANAKAVLESTDVDALSKESLITSTISALEAGGALAYLSYVGGGLTAGMSAGLGASTAIMTLGMLIGLKATKDVIDTGEITKKTIVSDLLSAGAVGGGLFVAGLVLKAGTVGTLMAVGGIGAIATFGALIGIQAILALSKKDEPISWGNERATEKQIKDFVEEEIFTSNCKVNLTAYSNAVELGEGEDSKITAQVEKLLPELAALKVGIDTDKSIENIRSMIFDEGGLIDLYNEKYETSIATVKAAINLVPIKDKEGNDISAEYFKGISSGWQQLNGIMAQLGKDLADEMVKANNSEMNSAARRIYENNVGILSQIMIDVNSAIASRHTTSESQKTFREGVENWDWDQQSYTDLITFYNEQKNDVDKKIEAAYQTYYDELDDLIVANETLLADAEKYGLTEIGGKTIEEIKNEITTLNTLRETLDANKLASIEAAKAYYENGSGKKLLHDAIVDHLNTVLSDEDVSKYGTQAKLGKNIILDYFNNTGNVTTEAASETLGNIIDTFLKQRLGGNYDTIKSFIDAGILSYSELIDQEFISALRKHYGVSDEYEDAWNEFVNQYINPTEVEVENPDFSQYVEESEPVTADAKVKIENVDIEIDDPEGLRKELEDQINSFMQDTRLENWEREVLYNTYGQELVDQMLKDLQYNLDEEGWNMGKLRPAAIIGAGGMLTESGKLGGRVTPYTQPQIGATALETESMASDVAKGTAQGNEGQNDLIRELITLATRIANKEWVVNVTPGSGWGEHNARSNAAYERIRG